MWRARSYQQELLDEGHHSSEAIARNMYELDRINTLLGGHRITIKGVEAFTKENKNLLIAEIGCGGGDNLKAIQKWAEKKKIQCRFIGIDINPHCIAYAQSHHASLQAEWICSDYRLVKFKEVPDIIFNSLFCHHFKEEEIEEMIMWMKEESKLGFFINDLVRHPFAYYGIKLLTQIFSRSYLVKHDAPLSVCRGFTYGEWQNILNRLDITARIKHLWAFRHLIVYEKKI